MNPEEHRQRHQGPVDDRRQEARTAVAAFAFAGSVLDVDGVDLCFMNSRKTIEGVQHEDVAVRFFNSNKCFTNGTLLRTNLHRRILMPRLLSVPEGKVKKPLLVVIVTDGKPTLEKLEWYSGNTNLLLKELPLECWVLPNVIQRCQTTMRRRQGNPDEDVVFFCELCQVG